jgi:hypothetical protein
MHANMAHSSQNRSRAVIWITRGPPVSPPLNRELLLNSPNWPLFIDRLPLVTAKFAWFSRLKKSA